MSDALLYAALDNWKCRALKAEAEVERLKYALGEVANRAGNYMDDDAHEWMPSIYNVACNALDGRALSLEPPEGHHKKTQQDLWAKRRPPPVSSDNGNSASIQQEE
jgi:hypothetical protein